MSADEWLVEAPPLSEQIEDAEHAWAESQTRVERLLADHAAAKDATSAAFLELVAAKEAAAQAEKEATKELGQLLRGAIEERDLAWSALARLVKVRARGGVQ